MPQPKIIELFDYTINHNPTIEPHNLLAIDTETNGLDPFNHSHSLSVEPDSAYLVLLYSVTPNGDPLEHHFRFPVCPHTRKVKRNIPGKLSSLRCLIEAYPHWVFHNAQFDLFMLRNLGIELVPNPAYPSRCPNNWDRVHDTLPADHVLNSFKSHGLKDCALYYLDIDDDDEQTLKDSVKQAHSSLRKLSRETGKEYAIGTTGSDYWLPHTLNAFNQQDVTYGLRDVERTHKLKVLFDYGLQTEDSYAHYERERQVLPVFHDMTLRGVPIHFSRVSKLQKELQSQQEESLTTLNNLCRFMGKPPINLNSTKQLRDVLFNPLYLDLTPKLWTATGEPSTSKEVIENQLEKLQSTLPPSDRRVQFLTHLQQYRVCETYLKYIVNYTDAALVDELDPSLGWLHPRWNPNATKTTRITSSNPNGQNINKNTPDDSRPSLRSLFGPPKDYTWLCIDYDQLEARIFAHASQDPTLLNCFATGGDMHQITADALGLPRSGTVHSGKHINFAWLYGASISKLSLMAKQDATEFENRMSATYPRAMQYQQEVIAKARRTGMCKTLFGYPLRISPTKPFHAINYIVQGTAGDIAKNALIGIHRYLKKRNLYAYPNDYFYPILFIHDELIFAIHKDTPDRDKHIRHVANLMSGAGAYIGLDTPVNLEQTTSSRKWSELKPYKVSTISYLNPSRKS